jgi:MerR family transcriptional regulator, light-induced transcriptional regulator
MLEYSISDLEQLSGIKAHTLRIWEQRYQLLKPNRTDTNIRHYDNEQMKLLLNVALLRDHGFKISKIAKYSTGQIENEVLSISNKQLNFPDQIQNLTTAMLGLDEERYEEVLNKNISKFGFSDTMMYIIYPFLAKIGVLWTTGAIGPAQEHFMSSLIRQKLMVAIDAIPRPLNGYSKTIVLYLPEGEYHEIGLLFAYYFFKSKGLKVIYLGQSLPKQDLHFVNEFHHPDLIFTAITSIPNGDKLQPYLDWLADEFPNIQIFLTGYQVIDKSLILKENLHVITTIDSLNRVLNWV